MNNSTALKSHLNPEFNETMTDKQKNILILCTGNSARSILGEALINRLSQGRFKGFSAGSMPAGEVNRFAIRLLEEKGYSVDGFRSKSWDEFATADAPQIDFIFTVCDNAAGEVCPVWPGRPIKAHWGIPDPAAVEGADEDKIQAFEVAYKRLEKRISAFLALPSLETMDDIGLKQALTGIGQL